MNEFNTSFKKIKKSAKYFIKTGEFSTSSKKTKKSAKHLTKTGEFSISPKKIKKSTKYFTKTGEFSSAVAIKNKKSNSRISKTRGARSSKKGKK